MADSYSRFASYKSTMNEFIETFHIDWKLMIAQLFNFGVVFLAFYFLAAKPLRKLMKDREDRIKGGLENAKKSDELIKQINKEFEDGRLKMQKAAIDSRKETDRELQKIREENLETMKKDDAEWQKNRVKQMEIDKNMIVDSVKNDIVSTAVLMAQKLIGKSDYKFDEKEIKELHNLFKK